MGTGYDLRDRTVLITGASRGLGAALAVEFGRAGARVALCARGSDALERVAASVRAVGAACRAARVDIRDDRALVRWVESVERELGTPTTLVNNASVLGPRIPLAEHGVEEWRETLDINLTGAFLATRAVLPLLLGRADGSIVNVSSGAALPPRVEWGAYAVSKHALDGYSLNLAAELEGSGVRVNLVDPGAMRTEMRAEAYPAEDPAAVKAPDRAAPLFLWLASDASRGVTGRRFRADEWTPG